MFLNYTCTKAESMMALRNEKLCRCRGTARRATNTKYHTWKACNMEMTFKDTQGHHNCCY